MRLTPTTEVMYLKGVGPRRANCSRSAASARLRTFSVTAFRYEDRIRFANIREIAPGQVYTCRRKS